jgi:hypothetical protein
VIIVCVFLILIFILLSKVQLGEINGIAQTGVALARAVGPALGSPIYAWSVSEPHSFPFNYWFCFLLQSLLLSGVFAFSWLLPSTLDEPKVDNEEGDEMVLMETSESE